jgi:diguanylate cyclase (GGDEF)-like protein
MSIADLTSIADKDELSLGHKALEACRLFGLDDREEFYALFRRYFTDSKVKNEIDIALERVDPDYREFNTDFFEKLCLIIVGLDELTNLSSKPSFHKKLEMLMNESGKDRSLFSILSLDIDYFKKINDTHGHPVGDKVLQRFGEVINDNTLGKDFKARIGGEEFAVLLLDTNILQAQHTAEKLRKVIASMDLSDIDPDLKSITVSIGVTQRLVEDTAETIMNRADGALYIAKSNGRNRVQVMARGSDYHEEATLAANL